MEPYYKVLDVQFYVSLPCSSPAFQLHNYATKELGMSLGMILGMILGIRHFLHLKAKLLSSRERARMVKFVTRALWSMYHAHHIHSHGRGVGRTFEVVRL